jgi:hypothetical protein
MASTLKKAAAGKADRSTVTAREAGASTEVARRGEGA